MSNSIFTKISRPKIKRSNFNLDEEVKLSMNMGDLVPICCKEILPNDDLTISTELLIKFAPLAAPVMHRIQAYVHYFFVPTEQICSHWGDFINPKVNTQNNILLPTFNPSDFEDDLKIGSLADYLGLPVLNTDWIISTEDQISLLPFMAYQHIYNSYYRDENLEPLPSESSSSQCADIESNKNMQGDVASYSGIVGGMNSFFKLRKRAWAKDYFTSALPSPQAGDDVLLPMETTISANGGMEFGLNGSILKQGDSTMNLYATFSSDLKGRARATDKNGNYQPITYENGLEARNTSVTINDLRKALALQRFKELAERGGTRYPEMVRNFFGAFLPDWYVDRPIFLGGSKQPISIGEVVQTSSTDTATESALGQRGGIASSYGKVKTARLKAPCHGFLMGILSIRPTATYQQGLERMWSRNSIFDYPFPQFANLGEQEIKNKEIYASGDYMDDLTFGYTPRYAEWKEGHCHVCGEFRDTLSYWHFGRKFSETPTLSKEFVQMDNVSTDPFLVTDNQTEHVYVNLYNRIRAYRPLPFFGTPSII